MSQIKMLKNERAARRKAFMITAIVHLGIIGGLILYTNSESVVNYLPDTIQEWLPNTDADAETPVKKKSDKPRA